MDEFHVHHSVNNQEQKITFHECSLHSSNENLSEEYAKVFSIDDDDDDIIILDQSELIFNEVKDLLNHLIYTIHNRENHHSQIVNFTRKHSLDLNNDDEYLLNKKVRFNIPDSGEDSFPYLFVSESIDCTNPSKPYAQFLYQLGFDLCLEENLISNNSLSNIQQQTLINYNQVFHQCEIYSCKYCSFQTDIIHVMNHHYRTPHTLENEIYRNDKYRCIYCSFQTFRLHQLRHHSEKKHGFILIYEQSPRQYSCTYCSYETDDRKHFLKHNNRCQIKQTQTRIDNNLLAPFDQLNGNINTQRISTTMNLFAKAKNQSITNKSLSSSNTRETQNANNSIFEPIVIESDHDTSLSSDEDFIVSSDGKNSSSTDSDDANDRDFEFPVSRLKKIQQQLNSKSLTSLVTHSNPLTSTPSNLSSLTKLLLLNGAPIPSFPSSLNSNKPPPIPIQPKPTTGNDIYQMCNICGFYVYKNGFVKHINEKHNNNNNNNTTNQSISTPITILNNTTNNINTSSTGQTTSAVIVAKTTSQSSSTIFLLSTSTMDPQPFTLNMIKCPWCDTNFEHIDVMTGHLMRYHRMTLAAAKVVVAEQMKIQGSSSSQLSLMFKQEVEQIQKDFNDKIYWKISQPKVYLHQMDNLSCFICKINVDDIENHFLTSHQIPLITLKTIKQCCLCGFLCDKKNPSLLEHQLRTHSGVCYSSILKQFIRFEPPPPLLRTAVVSKTNRQASSSSHGGRALATYTEKKFGCRKCDTSSRLFTFEELVQHLRVNHEVNVKLHRRCTICQLTYLKGTEYNQHCLEHLNDEYPSISIKRHNNI